MVFALRTQHRHDSDLFAWEHTRTEYGRLIASAAVAGNWLSHRCTIASFSGFSHIAALLHIMEADLIAEFAVMAVAT